MNVTRAALFLGGVLPKRNVVYARVGHGACPHDAGRGRQRRGNRDGSFLHSGERVCVLLNLRRAMPVVAREARALSSQPFW